MYGMQYIQQTIVGIDGSEARFFGYVADNSEEMEPDRIRPAILILPGGGYAMTSDREAEPVALQFLAKGFAVFVLRYSVQPSRYPVALLEAAEAMRLIRANADQWHVNPAQVAVLGFSAGGHLAANLATSVANRRWLQEVAQHPERYTIAKDTLSHIDHWRGLFIKTYGIAEQKHYKTMYEGLLYGDPKMRILRILWTTIYNDHNARIKEEQNHGKH